MGRDNLADFQSPSRCGTEFLTDFLQRMLADFNLKYGEIIFLIMGKCEVPKATLYIPRLKM
jgi:hypothetical protein